MNSIEIVKPDDWHVHFRDGEILKAVKSNPTAFTPEDLQKIEMNGQFFK